MNGIEQALEQVLTYLKGVWIKKRYIIISTWLLCPLGWAYVVNLPDEYESSARLFVDTNSLLRPLLRGLAVYDDPNRQVALVAQTLLSRPNLEKIARDADLDIQAQSQVEMDEIVDELKEGIKLNSTRERNIYTISYTSDSAVLSQKIVQITLDEFVESSLGQNRKSSDSAERFLNDQIAEYEQRLSEAEQRLADFRASRFARAPSSMTEYNSRLQSEKRSLEETELNIIQVESQLEAANARLRGEEPVFGLVSPEITNSPTLSTKYDGRIAALESRLDELLIRYTENHPDVRKTNALIESLRNERQKHIESLSAVAESTGSYTSFGNLNQNPVYQQMKMSVAEFESQLAALKVRADQQRSKIVELERLVDLVPAIEAEAQGLNRDYEITQQKYLELLSRREQAEISRKADATADDVKFRVIEPPQLPNKPSGPIRSVLYTLIVFVGFGAGVGIAFLVSQIKPVVISPVQLASAFNIPVLGKITELNWQHASYVNKRRMFVFILSNTFILLMYAILMGLEFIYGGFPKHLLGNII